MSAPRYARVPRFRAKPDKYSEKQFRTKFGRFCEPFAGQDFEAFSVEK